MQADFRNRAPEGSPTLALIGLVAGLRWEDLPAEVRHAARRHLLDTLGVMIRGGTGDMPERLERLLGEEPCAGGVPVPGRARRLPMAEAAWVGGTAGHGLELDDGYRQGSIHPGVAVIPAALACAHGRGVDGRTLLTAVVAGYETIIAVSRAAHPHLRRRGFHPTGAVGTLGAAMAAGRLLGLDAGGLERALGIAASSSAGLFAFLGGGGDVKRLHAGHAAREGLTAARLAAGGMGGPPQVLEARDGFFQAFGGSAEAFALPPDAPFGMSDCYIKPHPCCRHLQPAAEALIELRRRHDLHPGTVRAIRVETYSIAAAHAHSGWDDAATAQLSFPYVMALALRFGQITLDHFEAPVRADPGLADIARRLHVRASAAMDARYPGERPALVEVETDGGTFRLDVSEALGSRLVPFGDDGVLAKFISLTAPVLGETGAGGLCEALWSIETRPDVTDLIEMSARRP